jgi:hypothetical protein
MCFEAARRFTAAGNSVSYQDIVLSPVKTGLAPSPEVRQAETGNPKPPWISTIEFFSRL